MKKVIAFMVSLLLFVSSLQLCSATEIDSVKVNNSNIPNGYPIIIQMPVTSSSKDSKDPKDSSYEKYKDIIKDILSFIKWGTITGFGVFLYNKYHEAVEKFVGQTTENVEKFTSGAANLTNVVTESGGAIAKVTADRLDSVITTTEWVAGGAVVSYFITAVASVLAIAVGCQNRAPGAASHP